MHAGEASAWDNLHERFEIKRINHQEAYGLDGACTHMAEKDSRLRRAGIGIHQHIAGSYLPWCGGFDIRFSISASPPSECQIQNRTRIILLLVPLWF